MMQEPQNTALTVEELAEIMDEIVRQPSWRNIADREMDYAQGNQLDSELLQRQRELGIPPAIEDLIGPALRSIQGYESTTRTDWRVTPDGGTGGQDIADALNYKLNQAERESKADRACGDAFYTQVAVGLGWAEVSRDSDPMKFPYRCAAVHRNEIHWDMQAKEPMLGDARWLRRTRWMRPERITQAFPDSRDVIEACGRNGSAWWADSALQGIEGGASTGLHNAWANLHSRGWTIEEAHWYDPTAKEICLSELWYRRWESAVVLKMADGRAVEFDEQNEQHIQILASGQAKPVRAPIARVRRSYWIGPHCLYDGPSPYSHRHFPYVPFWGFVEDRTGTPFGFVRSMVYQQDAVNSGTSKLRWGMSAVRTERTKGAVAMTDAQFRRQIGRSDADIVLDAGHMAKQGARFDVHRDYQLTDQHYQMLQDSRAAIERVSAITSGFAGRQGTATSGLQEQTQVEQSNQSLASLMDSFRSGRSQVGELLLSMIVEDLGTGEQTVIIEGDAVREDRTVVINKPETDPRTGYTYLSNDLQQVQLKVALEDVPSTNSYRGQQLNAMSEAVKSMPQQYQAAVLPFLVSLMDVPFKRDVIEAIRAVDEQQTPEQMQQAIDQAVQDALVKSGIDLKTRELELKYSPERMRVEIDKIVSEVVKNNVASSFAAMQAGEKIALVPQIAPIADVVMQESGWRRPSPAGQDPNFPQPQGIAVPQSELQPNGDTSPLTPASPESAYAGPNQGMDTIRTD